MKSGPVTLDVLRGVFVGPPLARRPDAARSLHIDQNDLLVRHLLAGGLTRLLYGGNAFLYHVTRDEFETLVGWLAGIPGDTWAIPSIGPSFGHAVDQARSVSALRFPTMMLLPCSDPRDAAGLERGISEIADAAGVPLIVYVKDEDNFGRNREAGLDAVARLVNAGTVVAIKYAVVRPDPQDDPYLDGLLARVDRRRVISGMGERPAVAHLRHRGLPGFTPRTGPVPPSLSQSNFDAASRGDWTVAEDIRAGFLPLEDVRVAWGPARVLHAAVEEAGLAATGPIPPFMTELDTGQRAEVRTVAQALAGAEALAQRGARA
jgi:dihydrodipicolinate synthase/N-acetylneuraminate lyase